MSWLRTPTMQLSTSDTVMVSSGIFFFSFLSQGLVPVSDLSCFSFLHRRSCACVPAWLACFSGPHLTLC